MRTSNILIIEDDEDLASIFAEALRGIGYEVELVADGRLAQERLKTGEPPFLILLDMHLPHVSGGDLLTKVIKTDERLYCGLVNKYITTAIRPTIAVMSVPSKRILIRRLRRASSGSDEGIVRMVSR